MFEVLDIFLLYVFGPTEVVFYSTCINCTLAGSIETHVVFIRLVGVLRLRCLFNLSFSCTPYPRAEEALPGFD